MKRKAISPEEMNETYKACLERERKRRYKWRKTKQGEFESSFVSFDAILDDSDGATDKLRCSGTLGSVITKPDSDGLPMKDRNKLIAACTKLKRHGKEHLVRALQLIAKNGTNREESTCQLMIDARKSTKQPKRNTIDNSKNSANSSVSKRRKLQSPEKK